MKCSPFDLDINICYTCGLGKGASEFGVSDSAPGMGITKNGS